jgi:hypothetical protein
MHLRAILKMFLVLSLQEEHFYGNHFFIACHLREMVEWKDIWLFYMFILCVCVCVCVRACVHVYMCAGSSKKTAQIIKTYHSKTVKTSK